jgi:hypothetical protein
VTGYYSSHYSIRSIAHLLGLFCLYGQKRVVQWQLVDGRNICTFRKKGGGEREHKLYWNWVKQDEHFNSDPLFRQYNHGIDESDVRHRDWANYSDHLYAHYPVFRAVDLDSLRERAQIISRMEYIDPPIPDIRRFVDLDAVQIMAYRRLVRCRQFIDEAIGGQNRFWKVHRNPPFAANLLSFQLVESRGLSAFEQ